MTRQEWIDQAAKCLAEQHGGNECDKWVKGGAQALAETYFDEIPNSFTPEEAVNDDLSYA